MAVETAEQLFQYELSGALDFEERQVLLLEQLQVDVDDQELKNSLDAHVVLTRGHAERLRRCFQLLHSEPDVVISQFMNALKEERDSFHRRATGGWLVLTPYSIALAEKSEHFEVGTYRGLSRQAESLGHRVCLYLLEESLWEEEQMASKLDRIGRRISGITQTVEVNA